MIKEFVEDHLGPIIGVITGIIIFIVIITLIKDHQDWERFKIEHKCKIVSKSASTIGTGFSSNGQVITTVESGKTGWLCDDGITYYK